MSRKIVIDFQNFNLRHFNCYYANTISFSKMLDRIVKPAGRRKSVQAFYLETLTQLPNKEQKDERSVATGV